MELLDNFLANKARCSCNESLHSRTPSVHWCIMHHQPFPPSLDDCASAVLRLLRLLVKLRQFTTHQLDQRPHRLAAEFEAAAGPGNLQPRIRDAVRAYCTVGEIAAALKQQFGAYQPPTRF